MKPKMECTQARDQFLELNAPERGLSSQPEVAEHVKSCTECERIWNALTETMSLMDAWHAPEPSPFFHTRLNVRLTALREEEAVAARGVMGRIRTFLHGRSPFGLPAWQPVMAGIFALALGIGVSVYKIPTQVPTDENPVVKASPVNDLQKLDQNQDLYSSIDLLDDIPNSDSTQQPAPSKDTDSAQKDTTEI